MDRPVKRAPFPVGTRLRYIGTHRSYTYDINPETYERKEVPLCLPGMIVTVDSIMRGHRGTLVHLCDEDGPMYYEDTGEPILDTTSDEVSVYHIDAWQQGTRQGRCIHHESRKEWEVVR